jgi:SAM-dependent methyltransferase
MSEKLQDQTIKDFGDQWTSYTKNQGYYASDELFKDIVEPLVMVNEFKSARVLDVGSGSGRIVQMLHRAGADHIIAVEPSRAFETLKINTASFADKITYHNLRGDQIPEYGDIDLAISFGVLHHIPEPLATAKAVHRSLKENGKFIAWLYGYEGNELYLKIFMPVRKLTTRLPDFILKLFTWVLFFALQIYIQICQFISLPMKKYILDVFDKLDGPDQRLVIYDQLNPAWAKYYTESEAKNLFESAGFRDVQVFHRHGYSWSVVGVKK